MKLKQMLEKIPEKYIEIAKEVGRWFVLGVVSLYLLSDGDFNFLWACKTVALRILDRLMHTWGKDENIDWLVKGLTRF